MTLQIGRFTPYEHLATSALGRAVTQPTPDVELTLAGARERDTIVGEVPPAPTAEAREMVDLAAERVDELRAQGRELHFTYDDEENRVVIAVRDLEGNVIKTIPPSKALDIMSGAEL
ncbi:MAG TPA: flagellar protein FlaG [Solirubrobacter sp.]|jgi:flagellar protein FlaG|nr:flagellar protein FlaG [Solirubrobacter sp.]